MAERTGRGAGLGWFDRPESATLLYRVLIGVCAALVAADLLYAKHGHYGFEEWLGFHGAYGFVSCVALVVAAKGLRRLLLRPEDYYDE